MDGPDVGRVRTWWRRLRARTGAAAPGGPAAAGEGVDERHLREARAGMLRETLEMANYSTLTHLAVSLVLGFIFRSHAPPGYLLGLNLAMFLLVSVTMTCTLRFRHRLGGTVPEALVRRGFVLAKLVALLIGLLWSSMPALLLPSHESGYQFVAVATTAGLISDAYVVGPIFAVSTLLIVPIVVGAFVGLFNCQYPFGLYVAALLVVYTLFVLFSTRRMGVLSFQRLLDRVVVQRQSQTIGLLLNEFEESATDWLWETDAEGRLLHAPPRMAAAIGEPAERLSGCVMSDLLARHACREGGGHDVAAVLAAMERRVAFHDHVVQLRTTEGTRWWRLNGNPAWGSDGSCAGYRGVGSDITRSHEAEARISFLASHDTLTGLSNRASFQDAVEQACRASGPAASTALLYLDLDGFKAINDGHGHGAGDLLLCSVAERLVALCGEASHAYRLGGDEFAILHPCAMPAQAGGDGVLGSAVALAEAAIAQVRAPHLVGGMSLCVGTSIGIACTWPETQDAATLLARADLALYSAKNAGRGQWRAFSLALEGEVLRRRHLDASMRAALAAGELELHYQPLVELRTEQVVGVEALLRWHLSGEGWISPAEIIPIAEATGFIADIGRWALLRACTDVLAWPGLTVAVNISPTHFRSERFCDEVDAVLAATGLDPGRLEVEITESILLQGGEDVAANMRRLRAHGVRLSLDDFGTGYSSLSYLSRFTFDKLKIDRSFVRELHLRRDVLAIFDAINGMAAALQMSVTVEGVEQAGQIEVLRKRFSGTIQGYYYSKPRPAGQIAEQVRLLRTRADARAKAGPPGNEAGTDIDQEDDTPPPDRWTPQAARQPLALGTLDALSS